jgi:uncharacterized glyoxalase superfamily protein PhnB
MASSLSVLSRSRRPAASLRDVLSACAVPAEAPNRRVALWLYCDDVDAEIARLREEGVEIAKEPEDMDWAERVASVRDPDGNEIYIGRRAEAT